MKAQCIRTKTHDEWLNCRRSGIGSSDVATVLGLNPFCTPYQLWRSRMEDSHEENSSEVLLLGHLLEDAIAQRWAIATGKEIIKASADEWIYVHPEKDYFRASPDRIFWDETGSRKNSNRCVLEIKSTQRPVDPENIPMYWFVQVQWQLYVMGLQKANLAWLTQGRDFGFVEIVKEDEFCGYMAEEVERFWKENIIGGQEPGATSVKDILLKYDRHTDGKVVEVGDDIYLAYEQLKDIKGRIAQMETQESELEDRLKLAFCDAESLSYHGSTIATWKSSKPVNRFDTKAFSAAYPELSKQFTRESAGSRRFALK